MPVRQKKLSEPKEQVPQLTRTDPSRTTHLRQPGTPVEPEQNHRVQAKPAAATTTRKPLLRAYTARVIERPRKWNTVAETHFQSDLSNLVGWYVAGTCRTVLYDVNTMLLQCAPNLFNLLLIHATNANATLDLTVNVLNNFELKRDTIQAKNDLPAQ